MNARFHVTLPTYVNYKFNIAVGLDGSTDLEQLYGLALRSSPRRDQLKLCNGEYYFFRGLRNYRIKLKKIITVPTD